ncbi:MAG: helix-turn-helix domain-containing protein [Alicyclobacillus herbarius]|uniref:helix-turn-helix domain-containing protein n=1 Tax=Alicyclobacillus herbarius TaxID=122960 RepID=UPI000403D15E|nr:helix-turn-helix domain-containing protein [Alicyclobacillus herbarius]MCL6633926.1 helix-turn-helix domain-containing protein [Alicyclobacillus herbarius]
MQPEELPPVLTMNDVARYLRIGRTAAYELAHRPDFPALRIGRLVRVNRETFLHWCGHPDYQEDAASGEEEARFERQDLLKDTVILSPEATRII